MSQYTTHNLPVRTMRRAVGTLLFIVAVALLWVGCANVKPPGVGKTDADADDSANDMTAADTGQAADDSGVVEDTGTPPADTGTVVDTTPADTGVVAVDTGTAQDTRPQDTGVGVDTRPADTNVAVDTAPMDEPDLGPPCLINTAGVIPPPGAALYIEAISFENNTFRVHNPGEAAVFEGWALSVGINKVRFFPMGETGGFFLEANQSATVSTADGTTTREMIYLGLQNPYTLEANATGGGGEISLSSQYVDFDGNMVHFIRWGGDPSGTSSSRQDHADTAGIWTDADGEFIPVIPTTHGLLATGNLTTKEGYNTQAGAECVD